MESTIGARIRQVREAKRLSVADFATAAGVKPSAIYGLESGANKPSIETVGNLRLSFPDLDTDWLLAGIGTMLRDGRALSQLPPAVPSEAKPAREGFPATPGTATPKEADFVGEVIRNLEKQIADYQAREAWYQDMLKKPLASADAAAYMLTAAPAPRIGFQTTASAAPQKECKMLAMHGAERKQEAVAA